MGEHKRKLLPAIRYDLMVMTPAFADPFNLCLRALWLEPSQSSYLVQCFALLSCRKTSSSNIHSVSLLLWLKLISSQLIHHKHGNQVSSSIVVGKPSMHLKLIVFLSWSFFFPAEEFIQSFSTVFPGCVCFPLDLLQLALLRDTQLGRVNKLKLFQ